MYCIHICVWGRVVTLVFTPFLVVGVCCLSFTHVIVSMHLQHKFICHKNEAHVNLYLRERKKEREGEAGRKKWR